MHPIEKEEDKKDLTNSLLYIIIVVGGIKQANTIRCSFFCVNPKRRRTFFQRTVRKRTREHLFAFQELRYARLRCKELPRSDTPGRVARIFLGVRANAKNTNICSGKRSCAPKFYFFIIILLLFQYITDRGHLSRVFEKLFLENCPKKY